MPSRTFACATCVCLLPHGYYHNLIGKICRVNAYIKRTYRPFREELLCDRSAAFSLRPPAAKDRLKFCAANAVAPLRAGYDNTSGIAPLRDGRSIFTRLLRRLKSAQKKASCEAFLRSLRNYIAALIPALVPKKIILPNFWTFQSEASSSFSSSAYF